MTPKEVPKTLSGLTKASKRHQKKHPKRHETNQKSKSKIDVNVIATATPPTQRSNKTTSKMISARRNARSAPPPHRGRQILVPGVPGLCLWVPCLDSLPELAFVPLHNPPRGPAHSAGPTPKGASVAFFSAPKSHSKFHSIFEGLLAAKMVPKAFQNDAKIHKKCMFFPGVFSYRFFFNFGRFFGRISRRPTLDLHGNFQ